MLYNIYPRPEVMPDGDYRVVFKGMRPEYR